MRGASKKMEEDRWKHPHYWSWGTKPRDKMKVNKIAPFLKCSLCERDIISHPKLTSHLNPPFGKECSFRYVR